MAVTGHTVMSDAACRASALGAAVVASATTASTRALINPPTYVLLHRGRQHDRAGWRAGRVGNELHHQPRRVRRVEHDT